MSDTKVSVGCTGDPSVGIQGTETSFCLGFDLDTDEEGFVREILVKAFSEIWDDGSVWVNFERGG